MRITLQNAYFGLICLFPILTTMKGGWMNKLLFALLLVLHLWIFFSRPIRKRTLWLLVLMAGNYLFMLCHTDFPLENYNLLAYFPFFLMYGCFLCDNPQRVLRWLSEHRRYVSFVIVSWCAMVCISALIPGCYQIREGGRRYFGSFCRDIFRLGPSAVFVQVLIIVSMVLYGKKRAIWYMAVPMYCYLMGSSRTYLAIGCLLFVIAWYLKCGGKRRFWATVIPLGAVLVLLVAVSALGDKIAYTLDDSQYGDFWFRITSSRSYLWGQYLRAWVDLPLKNKLLGNDLEFTLAVANRWAHNDFIELLCSFGILGLGLYLYAVRLLFRAAWKDIPVPLVVRSCAVLVWLLNAMFNMHYVYFCAMLSYPILLFVSGYHFEKEII